ncbi:MAG TPA: 3-oxosteroid 1-dehydrogenase [Pseudonocardiaceae bacterium]|jgi:3-oxosteroid 1-dehydrogenase|nr:3-oxosteroid 1-dehydrogenase [Pseudonocardiaceae bacterium]
MTSPGTEPEFDLVVVGSGGAGMTAALAATRAGLSVLVVEKAATFGGSTARSGGAVWAPGNDVLRRAGVPDSPELARDYLAEIVGEDVSAVRQQALLAAGPAMLALVRERTPLDFRWVRGYSDYYPEASGGLAVGRSVEPRPLDGHLLGPELANLTPAYLPAPHGVPITAQHYKWLTLIARHPRGALSTVRIGARWLLGRARRQHLLTMGQALAAGLRAGLLDAAVPVWLNSPLRELCTEGDTVTGVLVEHEGTEVTVRARHGVLLAAGGFEHDAAMRQQYQRAPIGTEWTVGAKANTGDAIKLGQRLGAATDLMDDAWWGPSIPLTGGPYFCLAERTLPGCIMVNGAGRRFVNEAAPYVDAVHAMYGAGDGSDGGTAANLPTWLILDQRYRNRYLFAGLNPRQKFPGRWYKAGVLHRADTVAELAERIDLPPAALQSTIDTFNGFADIGVDNDFHRGDSAYDRYYSDPRNRPNPSLGALRTPPFYAVRMVPGDLGTKGGLRTDERARVLRPDGTVIEGLYAAGNTSASVMGHTYAGAGATIGPAMTFGYLAATDIAARAGTTDRHPDRTGGTR